MRETSWMARVIVPPLPAGGERIEVMGSIGVSSILRTGFSE
jgi:hypothetical protein